MPQTPTIYLDNASTSFPKAPGVADAVADAIGSIGASPGRGSSGEHARAAEVVETLRLQLARLLGSTEPQRVLLASSATEAMNTAILGVLSPPGRAAPRPRVVASALEHNAAARPLARLRRAGLIDLDIVSPGPEGVIDAERFVERIDERTTLAILTCASNAFGTLQPVAEVGRAIRERGLPTLLLADAAQTAGLLPIEVEVSCIDLCAFGSHKALRGPPGVGVLYAGPRAFDAGADPDTQPLQPLIAGGTGGVGGDDELPPRLPERFEPGTRNLPAMAGLLEALGHLSPDAIDHERALIARARERLQAVPGLRLYAPQDPARSVGVLSMNLDGWNPSDLAAVLDASFGIVARAGLHCAPWAHAAMGTAEQGGALRISPGPETTEQEIDACCAAIAEIARS
ncbi:MAG: aminotransferase class V-fold PLP-dependent enzyme [Phycisphaerales bacterium]|nr:aminotransferase class V-fold PLP-dependent enzyme [Phycisphaerales bacterium]